MRSDRWLGKNTIDVFESDGSEPLVGYLPMKMSCLFAYFLEASPAIMLIAIVIGCYNM